MSTDSSPLTDRKVSVSKGDRLFSTVAHVILVIWALLVVGPMLWTLVTSFKTSSEIFDSALSLPKALLAEGNPFKNYVSAWTKGNFGIYFYNTVIVVGFALFFVMLLGAMCAYVLARFKFRGSQFIYYLMLAGLTFPIFLAIVPLYQVLRTLHLVGTYPGLILTYVAFALPFTVFFLYAFFKTLPNEIYEAAQVDGAGEWTTFFKIMLPMAKPGLASVAIFNFLGLWNQYLLPVALNTNPERYVLSQGVASFASQMGYNVDFGALFAGVMITIIPVLIVYIIFQRQLQGSVSQGTMK